MGTYPNVKMAALSPRSGGDEYMKSYFDELDSDGSGSLDFSEVKKALRKAGKYAGEGQIQQLLDAADKNGDGALDFEEFKILMSMPPEKSDDTYRGAAAEFIGLILFQFFGGLASAGAAGNGIVLAVLIYGTAAISGGHLNPAVSLALCVTKQIPPKKMAFYWVAQFAGGVLGALFYKDLQDSPGCTLPCGDANSACKLTATNVFGFEFLATFLLVFTVFGAAVDPKTGAGNFAPLAIAPVRALALPAPFARPLLVAASAWMDSATLSSGPTFLPSFSAVSLLVSSTRLSSSTAQVMARPRLPPLSPSWLPRLSLSRSASRSPTKLNGHQ